MERPNSEHSTRSSRKTCAFYPPKPSPNVIRVVKAGLRGSIRRQLRVTEIDISADDLDRLRALKGERCLLTPSHSGGFEPHIILYLSKLLDDIFHYVAAIELFERSTINRWLLPWLGVYSIIRGAVDRSSFTTTKQILVEGKRWLVIFPEGEAIWQNSILAPFQQGVIQLAFKAYEDAKATDTEAHLYCVPIAIKYIYIEDMHEEIDQSLARLAARLSISEAVKSASRYEKLRRAAEAVLAANEKIHHVNVRPEWNINDRVQNLKVLVAAKIERQLDIVPTEKQTLLERIHVLFNAVDRVVYNEPVASEYEGRLAAERQQIARALYDDLWRLLQFVAIYDGYVSESMTAERFLDVLCLLEMEVFKKRRIWGPRKACIRVGEPIDLKDNAAAYSANKRDAAQTVNAALESSVRLMLDAMGAGCANVRA